MSFTDDAYDPLDHALTLLADFRAEHLSTERSIAVATLAVNTDIARSLRRIADTLARRSEESDDPWEAAEQALREQGRR